MPSPSLIDECLKDDSTVDPHSEEQDPEHIVVFVSEVSHK